MEAEKRTIFRIGGSKAVTIPTNARPGDEVYMIGNGFVFVDVHGELSKEDLEDLYFKDLQPLIMKKLMKRHKKE